MDAHITAMAKTLTPILMETEYNPMDGAHNIWGVIDLEPQYTKHYSSKFVLPPKEKLYDVGIARDATTSKVPKSEYKHTAKSTNRALYDAAKKGCVQFIMDVVIKTWYRDLNSPTNFYTTMTDLKLSTHLISNRGGLHETDVVTIQASMMKFYDTAEGIPQYINMLEEAQTQ